MRVYLESHPCGSGSNWGVGCAGSHPFHACPRKSVDPTKGLKRVAKKGWSCSERIGKYLHQMKAPRLPPPPQKTRAGTADPKSHDEQSSEVP